MKEIISYLYNINVDNCDKVKNHTIYKNENSSYLYEEVDDANRVYFINRYISYLNQFTFFSYRFVPNIYNEIISKYHDKNFVLIDVGTDYMNQVDFEEMLNFYSISNRLIINKIKYKNNWDVLWESKINYLYQHFNNHQISNKNIFYLFNYYISISENVLKYIIKIKNENYNNVNDISFVHRRIFYPNIKLNFFNPLNFIVDLKVRDIGEYIKSMYYNNKDYINDLSYFLKTNHLDRYTASMMYARIIYPSIFFDDYELNRVDISKYIKIAEYEKFTKKIYDLISSYIQIDKIDWLN